MASKGFRSAVVRRGVAMAVAALTATAVVGTLVVRAPERATASGTAGYWLVGIDGGVFNYGEAPFYGSTGSVPLNSPIVGFVPTPSAGGYWMVAGDGGIFAFGDASFFGSMGGKPLNRPIAAMAAAPGGRGYWLVASDGGVFAFGEAPFFGSMAGEKLSRPIVDFAATPSGQGYWMATSDGAVYGFGDAGYYGSVGNIDLSRRIQALAPTPSGHGYWLVAGDGGIFAFGDAGYFGAASGKTDKRVIDIAATATGRGYYLVTSNGQVFPFGDATSYGDASKANLANRITAMSAVNPSAARASAGGLAAVDDSAAGDEDAPINIDVLGNDRAPAGGGSLTLQSVTPPQHGRAQIAENRIAYQPDADYHGPDTFTYTVTDAGGGSATGTVHLDLAPVDDRPEAVDDQANITDGAPTAIDVTANDRGLGDGLKDVAVTQNPAHGQAVVQPDHKIGYTPTSGFKGTDTLEYRVTDTDDESSTGKVTITIGGTNHVPVAVDDGLTIRSGRQSTPLDVTSNDNVPDGAREVRFAGPDGAPTDAPDMATPAGGIARRNGTRISYTAPAGAFSGSDSFPYVVIDNDGEVSKPATVRASVVINKAPQVKDGTVAVPQNRQAAGSLAKLGWDPEKDAITFSLRSSPAGQLTLKPDGSFLYQAPAGVDVDAFSFVANDGNSDSNEGHLSIQVTQAQATAASSTTTTGPAAAGPTTTTTASSTTSTTRRSTTPTTGRSTATTSSTATTATTGKSPNSSTTAKPTGASSSKPKKAPGSNNHGKTPPSGTSPTTTTTTKAILVPMLPLAAVPAVARRRRRRRQRR
ncbi:MAG: hypothetical protein QOF96_3033 [Actinomycetota bacterium]|nr:hypothetical protein [Actinomycetota bacterium]